MKQRKEILDSIGEKISIEFSTKTITQINEKCILYSSPVDKKYRDLTVEEFFMYCKIDKLEEMGIIPKYIADSLHFLVDNYLSLKRAIVDELYKESRIEGYNSTIMRSLNEKKSVIEAELIKFHLLPKEIDLSLILELMVGNEQYDLYDYIEDKQLGLKKKLDK